MTSRVMPRIGRGARRARSGNYTHSGWVLLFVGPMAAGLAIFYIYPIINTIYLSLGRTGVFGGWSWIGAANYFTILTDPEVARSLLNTIIYAGLLLLSIPIALVIAALLNVPKLRFRAFFRVAFFLPVVTMPVAIGWIWNLIYNGDFGTLNYLLGVVGIQGPSWLTNSSTALLAIGIAGIWLSLGYPVILFTAALQNVPSELLEAAEIDGAGAARRFTSVTIPLITPTIFFTTVLTVIGALQVFDLIYIMIPVSSPVHDATESIIVLFYEAAFVDHNQGLGAAIVILLMVLIMALTLVQFRLQRRWVHYE